MTVTSSSNLVFFDTKNLDESFEKEFKNDIAKEETASKMFASQKIIEEYGVFESKAEEEKLESKPEPKSEEQSEIDLSKTNEFYNSSMKDEELEVKSEPEVKPVKPTVETKPEVVVEPVPEITVAPVPVTKPIVAPVVMPKVQENKAPEKVEKEERPQKVEKKEIVPIKPEPVVVTKPVEKKKPSIPPVTVISPVVPVKPTGHKSTRKRSQEQPPPEKTEVEPVVKPEPEVKPEKSHSAPAVSTPVAVAPVPVAPVPAPIKSWASIAKSANPNEPVSTPVSQAMDKSADEPVKTEENVNIDPMARKISEILYEKDESPKDGKYSLKVFCNI